MFAADSDQKTLWKHTVSNKEDWHRPVGDLRWLSQESSEVSIDAGRFTELKGIEKHVLDVLGAGVGQHWHETFAYRRRGEDTLSWGEPDEWINVQWLRTLSLRGARPLSGLIDRLRESYASLQEALESARLHLLNEIYEFRDHERVLTFLSEHPVLIVFLEESYVYLQTHFGVKARYVLEVVDDPEVSNRRSLVVYIVVSLSIDEALTKLDLLDRDWYLRHIDEVGELVNFNLEFE